MPGGGARAQNLVHLKQIGFLCSRSLISWEPLTRKHSYLDHRYPVGLALIP